MGLQGRVEEAFSEQGALSRMTHEFRLRPGQLDMAQAVTRTLEEGGVLVVEAGTGIGKTFAYLVPALLSGNRVLLSTATWPTGRISGPCLICSDAKNWP